MNLKENCLSGSNYCITLRLVVDQTTHREAMGGGEKERVAESIEKSNIIDRQ